MTQSEAIMVERFEPEISYGPSDVAFMKSRNDFARYCASLQMAESVREIKSR